MRSVVLALGYTAGVAATPKVVALSGSVRVSELSFEPTSFRVCPRVAGIAEDDALGDLRQPPRLAPRPDLVRLLLRDVTVVELELVGRTTPRALLLGEEERAPLCAPAALVVPLSLGIGVRQLRCPGVAP